MYEERFYMWLSRYEEIERLWGEYTRGLNKEGIENELFIMKEEEEQMIRFFASIWLGCNDYLSFDIFEAMKIINEEDKEIIIEWVKDPFYL